jgi:hypothetical protein
MERILTLLSLTFILLLPMCTESREKQMEISTAFITTSTIVSSPIPSTATASTESEITERTVPVTYDDGTPYGTAVKLFESGDYVNSRIMAEKALQEYEKSGDNANAEKAKELIAEIGQKIKDIKKAADSQWSNSTAMLAIIQEKESAKDYSGTPDEYYALFNSAQNAKDLYQVIGDKEGYARSRGLIANMTTRFVSKEGDMIKKANETYSMGERTELSCKGNKTEKERRDCYAKAVQYYKDAKTMYAKIFTIERVITNCGPGSCDELRKAIYACDNKMAERAQETNTI